MGEYSVPDHIKEIHVNAKSNNEPVTIENVPSSFQCIGIGTDAAVFRHSLFPEFAYKIYAKEKLYKKDIEASIYKQIGTSDFFSTYYGTGESFIILSFEEGVSLYDCLLRGITIPSTVIQDVEAARAYIKECELNPRDLHLKNILLNNGRAKIIDVAEYGKEGNDYRWEYLRKGYEEYYSIIKGRPVPLWVLETCRKWYNQSKSGSFHFDEFIQRVKKLTPFR